MSKLGDAIRVKSIQKQRPVFDGGTAYGTAECYRLEATAAVEFYATDSEYRQAYRTAAEVLLHDAHGDVLNPLRKLRLALYGRDYKRALDIVEEIERELLTPPEPSRSGTSADHRP